MAVFLNENGLVPALKKMTSPAVPLIEKLSVNSIQLAHAKGQVAVWCFYEKMIMIGHEAVGVTNPVISFIDVLEGIQKVFSVSIVFEDGLLFIAP